MSMTQSVMLCCGQIFSILGCCNCRHTGLFLTSHWYIWFQTSITVMVYSDIRKMDLILHIFYKTVIMTLLPSTCHTRNNHQQALRTILMNSSCTKTPLQRYSTSWDCVRQESRIVKILQSIVINHK